MKLMSWNARGMNAELKRKGVFKSAKGQIPFIQETKMELIDNAAVRSLCPFRDPSFVCRPSLGRSGGILLAWNSKLWQMVDVFIGVYSVSVRIRDVRANCDWVATSVYGPLINRQSLYRCDF